MKNEKIQDWSFESGYTTSEDTVYPFRATELHDKLQLLFNVLNGFDKSCNFENGKQLIIHHSADFPQKSEKNLDVDDAKIYDILITPKIIYSSENLYNYSPNQRKCYFSNEGNLKFFNFYTEENCRFECRTNYTLKKCGCVAYYMPRINII